MKTTVEPLDIDHAAGLFAALQDDRIYAFLDDKPPSSIATVRDRIIRLQEGPPRDSGETWINWAVLNNGTVVGYTQATVLSDGLARFAFVLSPTVWGQSVAYSACLQTLQLLAEMPAVAKIAADTYVENIRSQALLKRLGFHRVRDNGKDVFFERSMELKPI